MSSINASKPSLDITVPASNNPASPTKDPSSNTAPNPSIPPATLLTGSASSRGQNDRYVLDSILPRQEAFLVDAPTPTTSPHRWIQA